MHAFDGKVAAQLTLALAVEAEHTEAEVANHLSYAIRVPSGTKLQVPTIGGKKK